MAMHSLAWVARYAYQWLAFAVRKIALWQLACIEDCSTCPSAGSRKGADSTIGLLKTSSMTGRTSIDLGLKLHVCEACSRNGCFTVACQKNCIYGGSILWPTILRVTMRHPGIAQLHCAWTSSWRAIEQRQRIYDSVTSSVKALLHCMAIALATGYFLHGDSTFYKVPCMSQP